ncbi:PDZ domain-containing protein [Sorangium sp. So ce1128]
MEILGILARLIAGGATVGAYLGARWLVATVAGVPQAFMPFRRFDLPARGAPRWVRPLMTGFGLVAVYLVSSLFFAAYIKLDGEVRFDSTVRVVPGMPAERAGIRDGDRVVRVAGRPVLWFEDIVALVNDEPGRQGAVEIVVERDGAELTLRVEPEGTPGGARIGVHHHSRARRIDVGTGSAIAQGLMSPAEFLSDVGRLGAGDAPVLKAERMKPVPETHAAYLLMIMGYLSLVAGVIIVPLGMFGWRPRKPS